MLAIHYSLSFFHTINNSLPIDVQLEKKCLKFWHSCINCSNAVVKSISLSSIQQSFSTFGENYRYLCHKYKIIPYMFRSDFPIIIKQMHLYVVSMRTVVKLIEVFYGVESVVRGNADSFLN